MGLVSRICFRFLFRGKRIVLEGVFLSFVGLKGNILITYFLFLEVRFFVCLFFFIGFEGFEILVLKKLFCFLSM